VLGVYDFVSASGRGAKDPVRLFVNSL